MKKGLFFTLLITLPFFVSAKVEVTEGYKQELKFFSTNLCTALAVSSKGGEKEPEEVFEDAFISLLQPKLNRKATRKEVVGFYSKNKNLFICSAVPGKRLKQHLLKRVVDLRITRSVYYKYLLREEHLIDLNAVELISGQPETLVDYLDKREKQAVVNDEELLIKEIKKLRKRIMHKRYGAKRAKDLPPEALEHLYQ